MSIKISIATSDAVGSVATKELDAYGVYQGNPAILKRQRELKYV